MCLSRPWFAHVINYTEAVGGKVAYKDMVQLGIEFEDAKRVAELALAQMEATARLAGKEVSDIYAGACADNVKYNVNAMKFLMAWIPFFFGVGCMAHALDLLCHDWANIAKIKAVLEDIKFVVKFIKNHSNLAKLFAKILDGESGLTLYPDTRFAYIALMLTQYSKNRHRLHALLDHQEFRLATSTISGRDSNNQPNLVAVDGLDRFTSIIDNPVTWRQVSDLLLLFEPLCAVIHFIESDFASISWVMALLAAIQADMLSWKDVARHIDSDVKDTVESAFKDRWEKLTQSGAQDGRYVALKSPHHILAIYVYPYLCPSVLSTQAEKDIQSVFDRVYAAEPAKAVQALLQFRGYASGRDGWAEVKEARQTECALTDEELGAAGPSQTARTIAKLKKIRLCGSASDAWMLTYRFMPEYSLLVPIVLRLLAVSATSASVERVCSQHRIVVPKGRSRLGNKNAMMALYCYVNLRLLNKVRGTVTSFLESMMETGDDDVDDDADGSTGGLISEESAALDAEGSEADLGGGDQGVASLVFM